MTKQDEIVEIAVHDVETGEEFDSGLISIAESATRREVRRLAACLCVYVVGECLMGFPWTPGSGALRAVPYLLCFLDMQCTS